MHPGDPFQIVGTTIAGKYRVDGVVGEGGFGVVYRGMHTIVGAPIAIKCMKVVHGSVGDAQRASDTFLREARVLFSLAHPSIVRMYDVGALTTPFAVVPYVVLELLDGISLEQEIWRRSDARAPFSAHEILALFEPVLDALTFAHGLRIAHRDLKPSNVMLVRGASGAMTAKVLDFGMARVGGATQSSVGATGFTPRYASPEQWDPTLGVAGAASDTFSLGLMVAEACTMRPAIEGEGLAQVFAATMSTTRDLRLGLYRPDLPPALGAVLARATRVSPAERFPSARELGDALRAALGPGGHLASGSNALPHQPTVRSYAPPAPFESAPMLAPSAPTQPVPAAQASPLPMAVALTAIVVAFAALLAVGAGLFFGFRPGGPAHANASPIAPVATSLGTSETTDHDDMEDDDTPTAPDVPAAGLSKTRQVSSASPSSSARPKPSSGGVRTLKVVGGSAMWNDHLRKLRATGEPHYGELRACWEAARAKTPGLTGELDFMISTDKNGVVTSSMFGGSSIEDKEMRACAHRSVMRWKFPPVDNKDWDSGSTIYCVAFGISGD